MTILFLALWLQMSAHQSWIVPNGECGQHADGSYTDCCGAMMKTPLNQEFSEAAQRAADETDGKPPEQVSDRGPATTLPITIPAEPVDVPAVQETREVEGGYNWCNACTEFSCTAMACDPHHKIKQTFDTCAEKSRVLLTSEDGKKHCIKF